MKLKHLAVATAAALAAMGGPASAQISDDVVRIGVLNDMSGLYADITGQGSVVAARMAVEDFQKQSKAGLKVEVVSADHQNKPDVGSTIVRQWIDTQGVDAVVDVPTSSVALAVNEVIKQKGKAHLNSGAATSDLTGKACSPNTVHWLYDTWMLANGTGSAVVKTGGDSWFFLTADYAFGHALERDTTAVVKGAGGQVLGSARHPLNTSDFSSFLLTAQASKAKIVGLANGGGDMINSIKQAAEFGIVAGGQRLAALLIYITDVHSLGLQAAQGLVLTAPFYWDQTPETRAWATRFIERHKMVPTMVQAGVYGAVTHYLKAVDAIAGDQGTAVVGKMRDIPIADFMTKNGKLREDGRVVRDMYLFQVKKPAESKHPYDYYTQLAVIPGEEAFRPMNEGECPLVSRK